MAEFITITERVCNKCGKTFIPAAEHMYRDPSVKGGIYCSYTCWLHRNDGQKAKKRGYVPKMVEQYSLEGELIRVYQSSEQAAEFINCALTSLQRACRSGEPLKKHIWRYAK